MFGVMIVTGPKFYTVPSPPPYMTFMLTFYIKIFRTSLFPNPMMDLVLVWYGDRYWSKILHSTTSIHDLKVKVMNLELSY